MTASLGSDPHQRPVQASVVIALIWSALVTSLGSTLTAVAGLALHAGYHDQHVGITKRIVRFLRSRWKKDVKDRDAEHNEYTKAESRTPSPYPQPSVLSAITDGHRKIHEFCSFRAAVVSARVRISPSEKMVSSRNNFIFLATWCICGSTRCGAGRLLVFIIPFPCCTLSSADRCDHYRNSRSPFIAHPNS